jgi:hypothetical protein
MEIFLLDCFFFVMVMLLGEIVTVMLLGEIVTVGQRGYLVNFVLILFL